jgi:formylglycine-generating enzyme required for sulfatase activity
MATDSHEGSGFATPHADDDVQDGKCTACGTVNSDVSRKFCKKCGQGLRNACLKCDAQIPVWEAICGECGANQPQLLANMRVTLDRKRLRAERLAESGSCEEAIVLAREIAAVTHPHLSDVASWAVSFARDQAEELERQNTFAVRQLAEAQQYASARHDAAAIAAIELIPHPMRDSDAQTLLATCMARRDADRREHAITIQGIATQLQRSTYRIAEQIEARITDLESKQTAADVILEIKERVRTKEIDGLIPQVRRAIAMGGDPPALQKLLTQLMDRRNTKINEARVAFNAGSARSAAAKTAILRFEDLDAADRQFVEQARHAGHLEDQIVALVKNARSGDGVSQQQVWNMLGLSTEFLAINPHNEQIYSLLQRCKNALPKPLRNSVGIAMQQIPAGSFTMDDPDLRHYGESHRVALSQSFFIGVYTVTNAQWARLMGSVPSRCKDDDLPVEAVSWEAAVEFCKKLSALPEERKAGRVYRLPTTEEWEYACRGGTTTDYSFGSDASRLGDYGWYRGNAGGQTQPVGLKTPNPCGLYDMHGNVWEWSSTRQQRGGCYDCVPEDCRSGCSYRGSTHRIKKVGFRLALDVPKGSPQQASR